MFLRIQKLTNEKKVFDDFYVLKRFVDYSKVRIIDWCPSSFVDVLDKREPDFDKK